MLRAFCILALFSAPVAAQDFFTLKGHGGPIMDIAVSPSGQIATASFDNAVGVWEGREPLWLDGHEAAVTSVGFLSDGTIISGGDDFTLRAWAPGSANGSKALGKHQAKIISITVSSTGLIATASWDATIGLWTLDGEPRFLKGHRQGVNDVVFSADGARLYSVSTDGTVRIWDVATGEPLQQLVSHGFGINELIVNEAEGWLAYGAVDGGTRMVDLESGELIADFTLDRRPILSMAYDAKSRQLAVGDGEGYVMVIDTKARKITRDFRAARTGPIWALAFSPDGQNLHAGGIEDVMYSWPVATLDEHNTMEGGTRSFLEDPDALPNGERQFKRKCSICHTVTEGSARKAGPSLFGVFGRRAGTVADYAYSDTLTGSTIVWSADTINGLFNEGPDHYIPGTKMPMQVIAKQVDRDDLIDYLRIATQAKEN
ncbi:c-type cytochrome [Rhodobacteraceae bacterium]|nr:c-type cytochrome [Paracoccaceae bacterium]